MPPPPPTYLPLVHIRPFHLEKAAEGWGSLQQSVTLYQPQQGQKFQGKSLVSKTIYVMEGENGWRTFTFVCMGPCITGSVHEQCGPENHPSRTLYCVTLSSCMFLLWIAEHQQSAPHTAVLRLSQSEDSSSIARHMVDAQ